MMFRDAIARTKSVYAFIRMGILTPVVPGSAPTLVINEHSVPAPVKAVITPAPRPEGKSE
jgi:hypothetical protein